MRIALGQINTTVGDITGNVALIGRMTHTAAERGAELAVFPELSITGYPPRDLVERRGFVKWRRMASGSWRRRLPHSRWQS